MRSKHDLIMATDDVAYALLSLDERPWYIPEQTRRYLLEKYHHTCAVCHRTYEPGRLHIDHRVPVHMGGKAHLDNLEVLCYACNLKKGPHILDPKSYEVGYPIPIIVRKELEIKREVLDKVYDDFA